MALYTLCAKMAETMIPAHKKCYLWQGMIPDLSFLFYSFCRNTKKYQNERVSVLNYTEYSSFEYFELAGYWPVRLIVNFCFLTVHGQLLQPNSVHRTPAAERPANDLWCYRCQTMEQGDRCSDLRGNHTALSHKCKDDKERLCMVCPLFMAM